MKASEFLKLLKKEIKEHGDLEILLRFDNYCHEECNSIEFYKADSKNDEDYFLIQ